MHSSNVTQATAYVLPSKVCKILHSCTALRGALFAPAHNRLQKQVRQLILRKVLKQIDRSSQRGRNTTLRAAINRPAYLKFSTKAWKKPPRTFEILSTNYTITEIEQIIKWFLNKSSKRGNRKSGCSTHYTWTWPHLRKTAAKQHAINRQPRTFESTREKN